MSTELQIGKLEQLRPDRSFLKLEQSAKQDLRESALEVPLFDFASTPTYENGDPAHVHYLEDETLVSLEFASNGRAT